MMFRRPLENPSSRNVFDSIESVHKTRLQELRTQIVFVLCAARIDFLTVRDFKAEILSSQPFINVCSQSPSPYFMSTLLRNYHIPRMFVPMLIFTHCRRSLNFHSTLLHRETSQHGQEKVKCLRWFHSECFKWSNDLRIACVNVDVRGSSMLLRESFVCFVKM